MNNKGIGSGLAIIIILIVALLIAFLTMKNMGSFGNKRGQLEKTVEQDIACNIAPSNTCSTNH